MNQWGLMVVGALAMSLLGCSAGTGDRSNSETEESAASVAIQLGTTGSNGNRYRLGPAQFKITETHDYEGLNAIVVDAGGDADSLNVPLASGSWTVTLNPGWKLQRVGEGNVLTPVPATLLSEATTYVSVSQFHATPVNFAFHLGESGIDIGVTVDEGVPPGYDGTIKRVNGSYEVEWAGGGGSCCFSSVAEARSNYSWANLLFIE